MVVKAIHINIKAPNTFAKAINILESNPLIADCKPFKNTPVNIKDGNNVLSIIVP